MHDPILLLDKLVAAHQAGETPGVYCICSANPLAIRAGLGLAVELDQVAVIEATSNQVNQEGGYTGSTPAQFVQAVHKIADELGLPADRILLGGDHLGPNPWKGESASTAMAKGYRLVAEYVKAGFRKIHLDASMPLGGDPEEGPSRQISAERSARLCQVAEEAYEGNPVGSAPRYIVGTEVPPPGGETVNDEISITKAEEAEETRALTRQAFIKYGLEGVWERVVGLVVQPGVDFGVDWIRDYNPRESAGLSSYLESAPGLVYEAHSTDYQQREGLRKLVEGHFAILKVGPALTHAFREAAFTLEAIENEMLVSSAPNAPSQLRRIVDETMLEFPQYWQHHYQGAERELRFLRMFSYSDRIRYYWTFPGVQDALERLINNLRERTIPLTLLSQYLPVQFAKVRAGALENEPQALILDKITNVLRDYVYACSMPED